MSVLVSLEPSITNQCNDKLTKVCKKTYSEKESTYKSMEDLKMHKRNFNGLICTQKSIIRLYNTSDEGFSKISKII